MLIAAQDLLALGAASCWAASALLSADPSKHLGAFAFVRWRLGLILLLLWPIALWVGDLQQLNWSTGLIIAISGVVGITLGDSALFGAMNALGPRRTGVLYATQAVFSALFGFVVLGERLGTRAYFATVVTMCGVMVAIAWGRRANDVHAWEPEGNPRRGIALGLSAAICQALGALIAKPVVSGDDALDPVLALALRVSAAWLALWLLWLLRRQTQRAQHPINTFVLRQTALSGWVGIGLGMGFFLWGLRLGSVGAVGVLSSITPILVLPLLWWKFGRIPAWGAWVGAALAVVGTALMVTR